MKINVFKMQILMGERGLTIKKLAELCGVSRQTISCIISGKGCTPRVAYKIATALDQELSQIVREDVENG
ncbi:MAG: helix-turn-helix transcriptional regulator [Ruminococcus sp.]